MKLPFDLGNLFFTRRFFLVWGLVATVFILSFFILWAQIFAMTFVVLILSAMLLEFILLFATGRSIRAHRRCPELLSNAEDNKISLDLVSEFSFVLFAEVIDELPFQLQQRGFRMNRILPAAGNVEIPYTIRPQVRGVYSFGDIHVFVTTRIGLLVRRFTTPATNEVKVYPSFLQLKHFQLRALPETTMNSYGRRVLRQGRSSEFDHIKEYTRGDDARAINWKASARRDQLMINSYMDEKSQQVYCVIDKGRLMKMPFNDMTLLDYAINASLMFSYVALQKDDKVGLLTFSEKVDDVIQPSKAKKQFNLIMETLYKQETKFLESNFAALYQTISHVSGQRSLLLLFTNFETYISFERQLPFLLALNRKHLLCVITFENTGLSERIHQRSDNLEDIYIKSIADKFIYEKKMMIRELQKNGILTIYSKPGQLSINVVNRYLELKAKKVL
jgi:uncharacterized protein (DUF58 family)